MDDGSWKQAIDKMKQSIGYVPDMSLQPSRDNALGSVGRLTAPALRDALQNASCIMIDALRSVQLRG